MSALLLALALVLAGPGDARARFVCSPAGVEVGEPFDLVLELSRPADGEALVTSLAELELDPSWVIFERHREPTGPDPEDARRMRTRFVWRVASLEPGTRNLAPEVTPLLAGSEVRTIDASAATVEVTGVLGAGEDAPRPLRGLRDPGVAAGTAGGTLALLLGLLALLLWGLLIFYWVRLRRRRPAPVIEPAPLERLAALEEEPTGAELARARHFQLTRLLREATDASLGQARPGLTDTEWLAAVHGEPGLSASSKDELAHVLGLSAKVKYGGETPTDWALRDAMAGARRALEAFTLTAWDPAGRGGGA